MTLASRISFADIRPQEGRSSANRCRTAPTPPLIAAEEDCRTRGLGQHVQGCWAGVVGEDREGSTVVRRNSQRSLRRLEVHFFPWLGPKPIADVTDEDVMPCPATDGRSEPAGYGAPLYPFSGPEGYVFPQARKASRPISENILTSRYAVMRNRLYERTADRARIAAE